MGVRQKAGRGALIEELGASTGLTLHQTSAYRRVWRAHDTAVADDPDHRTPLAEDVYWRVRQAHGSGVGIETLEAILAAPHRRPIFLEDLSARGHARALRDL